MAVPGEKVIVAPLEAIPPIDESYLTDALESVPLTRGDNVMVPYFGGRLISEIIGMTPPSMDTVLITRKTVFNIVQKATALRDTGVHIAYEDIGGLKEKIEKQQNH